MSKKKHYEFDFSSRLREAIAIKGVTQKEVATWCDKDRKAVCMWVNGLSIPDVFSLKMLCLNLDVSPNWLLFGKEVYNAKSVNELELVNLFRGMSETMQSSVIEIMKTTQLKGEGNE